MDGEAWWAAVHGVVTSRDLAAAARAWTSCEENVGGLRVTASSSDLRKWALTAWQGGSQGRGASLGPVWGRQGTWEGSRVSWHKAKVSCTAVASGLARQPVWSEQGPSWAEVEARAQREGDSWLILGALADSWSICLIAACVTKQQILSRVLKTGLLWQFGGDFSRSRGSNVIRSPLGSLSPGRVLSSCNPIHKQVPPKGNTTGHQKVTLSVLPSLLLFLHLLGWALVVGQRLCQGR